jgi:hypothetical protein
MKATNRFYQFVILSFSLILILSCTLVSAPQGPDPSAVETDIANRVMATSLARDQLTLQAAQAQMTQQGIPAVPPTLPPLQVVRASPIPTQTNASALASLVLDIQTSVEAFSRYQPPYELTITVTVSDQSRHGGLLSHRR